MTGDGLLRNKLIPANVTAADSYAMEQIWELTVVVPGELGGQFVFLDYAMDKQTTADGGYKIEGGKVYYSEKDQYKELSLNISAGSKYIFKRVLNFAANTCDYIVTDATGKEVASAKGVAILAYTGKVSSIGITCKKVTGKILVDDYTLRVTGAVADFGVYDFKTGLLLPGDKTHGADTAYRFSWLNASGAEQTATVMADIWEGTTLKETKTIKELKMAPGCDGVETGVLSVAEGQSVKVYVKTDVRVNVEHSGAAEPEQLLPDPTQPTESVPTESTPTEAPASNEKGGNAGLIAVVIVAVVAIAAVAVALVLKKKKANK
jgi:hypothetical protein